MFASSIALGVAVTCSFGLIEDVEHVAAEN